MIIIYKGLNTILPEIRSKISHDLLLAKLAKNKHEILIQEAKLEVVNNIEKPEDIYEMRGTLWAKSSISKVFENNKDLDIIEAKLQVLDEIEGI